MTFEVHEELETVVDDVEALETNLEAEAESKNPLASKTPEELVQLNLEAQKQISRQGNEIGELRRLTDEILRKQLESTIPKKQEPELDWDYSPREAAEQLVNSKVDAIEAKLEEGNRQRALETFTNKHPNYKTEGASQEFRDWVMGSNFRVRMYEAGNAGDFSAADELFTDWNNVKDTVVKGNDGSKDENKKAALNKASMEKGGGSPNTKKIFRRSELRELRIRDKAAYEARAEEFHLAYKEGRVR